jgi:hypothetical protein
VEPKAHRREYFVAGDVRAPEHRQEELPRVLEVNATNRHERLIENSREPASSAPEVEERRFDSIEELFALEAEQSLPQPILNLVSPSLLRAERDRARVWIVYRPVRPLRNDVGAAQLPSMPAEPALSVHNSAF